MERIVEALPEETKTLIHDCIVGSHSKSDSDIYQRIEVVRLLADINPSLLVQKGRDGAPPHLDSSAHFRIIKDLVLGMGANVQAQDDLDGNILHSHAFEGEEYNALIMSIPDEHLRKLVNVKGRLGRTPLTSIVRRTDPLPETLDKFHAVGADFNSVDEGERSPLAVAIESARSLEILRHLIRLGADPHWRGENQETLLHVAAWNGNVKALGFLVKELMMSVNVEDEEGMTPLNYAITSTKPEVNRYEAGMVLQEWGGEIRNNSEDQSALHEAAMDGNIQSAQLLLRLGLGVDSVDSSGNTPLHLGLLEDTFMKEHYNITKLLLENNADPNILNDEGESPFDIAMKNIHLDFRTFQLLISAMDLSHSSELATLSLRAMFRIGTELDDDVFRACIKEYAHHKGDFTATDKNGKTLLHIAAERADERGVRLLLDQVGVDKYAKDVNNCTFLHIYVLSPRATPAKLNSVAKVLIERELTQLFNIPGGKDDATPFMEAVEHKELEAETLALLNANGVDFHAQDKHGSSLLTYAVLGDRSMEFITSLVEEYGVDHKKLDRRKRSILHEASRRGNMESLKYFVELGGLDINGKGDDSMTPLHFVLDWQSDTDILEKSRLLLNGGAEVNSQTAQGQTVLHLAALHKAKDFCFNLLTYMIESGADVYCTDNKGLSFLHILVQEGFEYTPSQFHDITEYLIKKGHGDLFNLPGGKDASTPLHLAALTLEPKKQTLFLLQSNGVSLKATDMHGSSILTYAGKGRRSKNCLMALIKLGDLDWKRLDHRNNSILHDLASCGNLEGLQFFLGLGGLDINGQNSNGATPLHSLLQDIKYNALEIGQWMIGKGAKPTIRNNYGEIPLALALRQRMEEWNDDDELIDEELIELLLDGVDILSYADNWGNQLLHLSAAHGKEDAVKYFLKQGVNVNALNDQQRTALHQAALCAEPDSCINIVKLLIDDGTADVNLRDENNLTFLYMLVSNQGAKFTSIQVKKLVGFLHDMDLLQLFNATWFLGEEITPFQFAVLNIELEEDILLLLHSNGVNFKVTDWRGQSVLSYAIAGGRTPQVISHLILLGAEWKESNKKKQNLLHVAAMEDHLGAMKLLLELGELEVNGVDVNGNAPLHVSVLEGNNWVVEMTRMLTSNGADVKMRNRNGLTAYDIVLQKMQSNLACSEAGAELLKLLQVRQT